MKKNLSTRIKRNLSRIKSLCIFITDVYLSLDSEFIVNYIESKNIVIMSDNRTIELHDNATYIENYGDGPKKKEDIIRKTKCFRILERNAKISKTKRNFSRLYPTPQKFKKIDRLRRNEIHLKAVRTSS